MNLIVTKQQVNRQIKLEGESVEDAIALYNSHKADTYGKQKDPTALLPENILLRKCIDPFATVLADRIKGHGRTKLEKHRSANEILTEMNHHELAFITARFAFNNYVRKPLQALCRELGTAVEAHYEYIKLKAEYGGFVYVVEKNFNSLNRRHKSRVLKVVRKTMGIPAMGWDADLKTTIGKILLDVLHMSTGMFEITSGMGTRKGKAYKTLEMTQETRDYVSKLHDRCSLLNPSYLPMIVPPKDWTDLNEGGFLTHKVDFIRSRNREVYSIAYTADLTKTYNAVNALQRTPWRINKKVLEVLNTTRYTGLGGLPLPELELELTPQFWVDDADLERIKIEEPAKFGAWIKGRADVYDGWHRESSKRSAINTKVRIANQFKDDVIYYCWNLDWRSRVYVIQNCFIHPQSDDTGKALIEFAKGKALGSDGAYWLAVHGSNCYGNDKVSLDERVKWVYENEEMILAVAKDPLDVKFWCDADSPYQFLAFCFEWACYKTQGEEFVSHLPVGMDGSCSGLQHYSALLKDTHGAKAVNLIPSDVPSDIYQQVADVTNRIINEDVLDEEANPYAKLWQGKVTRLWTKRNTMTTPYSATLVGFTDQIVEELRKYDSKHTEKFLGVDKLDYKAAVYLAKTNKKAIAEVVVKAIEGMSWLQGVAKVMGQAQLPLMWTTPTGFKVLQKYYRMDTKRVDTLWGNTRIRLNVVTPTTKINSVKQAAGIAPNYIHSMDASHLMLTVNACVKEGITDFSMIHDSFGCHASDVSKLNRILREQFVFMYSKDNLKQFLEEVKSQCPNDEIASMLPDPPEMGSLELNLVKESPYFFA